MAAVEEVVLAQQDFSEGYIRSKRRKAVRTAAAKVLTYAVLSFIGVSMLIPLLWMLSTSLKEPGAVFSASMQWIPKPVVWHNYVEAWNAQPFGRFYLNSIFVACMVTLGQVVTSSMSAYAFARLSFPGRDKIFFAYLATMMVPGAVTMIPQFVLIQKLNWTDTYWALILPGFFSAFGTFMLRQFFMTLPRDLEEAAKIDGCSLFGIYWKIIVPLSMPAIATLTTMTFMGSWNNFMWPLIVTNSLEMKTLPIGLQAFQGQFSVEWTLLMAASLFTLLPVIVVFLAGQRYFVEGIQLGAVKG